jgi:hypothetical protein
MAKETGIVRVHVSTKILPFDSGRIKSVNVLHEHHLNDVIASFFRYNIPFIEKRHL